MYLPYHLISMLDIILVSPDRLLISPESNHEFFWLLIFGLFLVTYLLYLYSSSDARLHKWPK